jgi:hypothetical protein
MRMSTSTARQVDVMITNSKRSKYEELEQIQKDIASEVKVLQADLKDAEDRLAAVTLAIQVWKRSGAKASAKIELNPRLREFRGLTQVQALTKIAKESGTNRFKMKEAKKLLIEAGLVKSKKNANTILFTAIQRSEKFRRVAPGEYELIPPLLTGLTADAVLKRA